MATPNLAGGHEALKERGEMRWQINKSKEFLLFLVSCFTVLPGAAWGAGVQCGAP